MASVSSRRSCRRWSRLTCVFLVLLHVLISIGRGSCVSPGSPRSAALKQIPVVPYQPEKRWSSQLAEIYPPSPTGSMKIKTFGKFLEVFVSLSMPEGVVTKFVEVNGFSISEESSDQTWYRLDVLDFSALKAPCNNPAYFLPAMAVTPDQQQLVFFGFGPLPQCYNVFMWKCGSEVRAIPTSNGEKVVHALHTIAISETTVTGAFRNTRHLLHVFSYGGMLCDCFASTKSHELMACVRQCKRISGTLWKLTLSQSRQDEEDGIWEEVVMSRSAPSRYAPPPLLRPSLNIQKSSLSLNLILYGGLGFLNADGNFTQPSSRLAPHHDLWLGSLRTGDWKLMNEADVKTVPKDTVEYFPFIPKSVYLADSNQLVHMDFPLPAYGYVHMSYVSMTERTAKYPQKLLDSKFTVYNPNSLLLCTSSDGLYIKVVRSTRVFKVGRPQADSTMSLPITEIHRQSSSFGAFPGSSSCYCPEPVPLAPSPVGKRVFLIAGGSCESPSNDVALSSWTNRRLWTIELSEDRAVYTEQSSTQLLILLEPEAAVGFTVTQVSDDIAIVLGGLSELYTHSTYFAHCVRKDRSSFHREVLTARLDSVVERAFHVAFRHNSSSLIVQGGLLQSEKTHMILCDIWIVSFFRKRNSGFEVQQCLNLTDRVHGKSLPCVYGHTYTEYQGIGLIYGGFCQLSSTHNQQDLRCGQAEIYTIFIFADAGAVIVDRIPIEPSIPQRALHSLTIYTANSLLLLGGVDGILNTTQIPAIDRDTFWKKSALTTSILIQLNMSTRLSVRRASAVTFFPHLPTRGAHVINGSFILSGLIPGLVGGKSSLGKLDPEKHCPLGYGRRSSSPDCELCPENHFSDSYGIQCKECERHATANTTGSIKCHPQSQCTPRFCHGHGVCKEEPNVFQATCICDFGYLPYDNCQVPFVSLAITFGVLLFAGLLTYALIRNQQRKAKIIKQRKKLHIQQLELNLRKKKLDELFDAVNVQWKYLSLVKRLYPDPQLKLPANTIISEVWEAELGDMPVAVKVLKSQHSPDSSLKKFVHEAEMLRVVNHPNIVNFLGAGTQRGTQRPFLIMELVKGGSLYQLLQNTDIHIDHKRRLSLAIDGAKGMEYLHGRNPPKIHRDLKSANLLVTSRGNVKVADFGTTHFIEILNKGSSDDSNLVDGPQKLSLGSRLLSGLRRCCQTGTKANDNAVPLLTTTVNHPVDIATGNSDEPRLPPITYGIGTDRWKAPETLKENYFDEKTDVYRLVPHVSFIFLLVSSNWPYHVAH